MILDLDPNADTLTRIRRNWQNLVKAARWGIGTHYAKSGDSSAITAAASSGSFVAFDWTDTLVESFLADGRGIRIRAGGVYDSPGDNQTLTLSPSINGALCNSSITTASGSRFHWTMDVDAICKGQSGGNWLFRLNGIIRAEVSGGQAVVMPTDATDVSVAAGVPLVLGVAAKWSGTTAADHLAKMTCLRTELLY